MKCALLLALVAIVSSQQFRARRTLLAHVLGERGEAEDEYDEGDEEPGEDGGDSD